MVFQLARESVEEALPLLVEDFWTLKRQLSLSRWPGVIELR